MKEYLTSIRTGETVERDYIPSTNDRQPPTPEEVLAAERATMRVSRFQARAAMLQSGLLDAAEAIVAAADPLTRLAWADAVEWRRSSPTVARLADALDLSPEEVDDLFRAAALIEA